MTAVTDGAVYLDRDGRRYAARRGDRPGDPDECVVLTPDGFPGKRLTVPLEAFLDRFRLAALPDGSAPPPPAPPGPLAGLLEVGARVVLKGRSINDPLMTVIGLRTDSADESKVHEVHVAYVPVYGGEGKILRDSFPPAALQVLPAGERSPPPE